ncbi:MAG: transketolase C-terminal domain-containing protein [Candidatus Brocadiia bacterium]
MGKPQRLVFGETLVELGAENDRIVVLDADVSSSTQTKHFAATYPERFFNFGVAEGNMVSAAAGFATAGYIPFVSTFAFLISMRAGDPVRAHVASPQLNVKLAGGYAGLSDFADGASHQSVEDLAVMRAIPHMTVIVPSDITETQMAVRAVVEHEGPVFLRLSRAEVTDDYGPDHPFEIGKGVVLRDGSDVTIVGTGPMVKMASEAAESLADNGIDARVVDMHTLKPLDDDLLARCAEETGAIVTVEEHNIYGGLGSAVCESVCESRPVPVLRCGIPDRFGESGPRPEILARAGLTAGHVCELAQRAVAAKR